MEVSETNQLDSRDCEISKGRIVEEFLGFVWVSSRTSCLIEPHFIGIGSPSMRDKYQQARDLHLGMLLRSFAASNLQLVMGRRFL